MPPQYTQSFRVSWLSVDELKGWLQPVEGDKTKAYRCYCKTDLNAKLCDLRKHATTQRHRKCANIVTDSRQQKIQVKPKENENVSVAEGKLALYIACHRLASIDHATETCKSAFSYSKITTNMKLHRTKCREVIVNILAPDFAETLREDIGDLRYSILIDESTDISVA
ncbi:hypothetical protein Pcinc_006845 [Petrolisthes cinctipes]|uniref:Uncharacterized protein n=1 Tax=Petrolisthes cinctipes TaxID=88211 RepID=A0AAE1KZ44_PETCI|nr:hypothetical protein Pcinc_006845 [Petrolisthes cinctipes]